MRSARGIPIQEPYIRSRENPYFDGLLRDYNASRNQSSALDFQGNDESRNISRTTSDISDARSKSLLQDISEKSMESPEDSLSDIVLYPIEQSTFGRLSKIAKATSFGFPNIQADLSSESGGTLESMKESSPKASEATEECPSEATEECHTLSTLARPIIEKSYSLNPRKQNLSSIPLPQSAASFYSGFSPLVEVVESCESINRLNLYLKCRRDDVSSGVPGRFLHAVIGQDVSDLGSIAATIMYAFYLNETLESDQLCTVPVINMKREDLSSHAEMKWLLDSCQIDELSLIFVDEIDLSYYDLFGSLKLVLLNGHKLPAKQEALKDAVVEIFNCRKGESMYPGVENATVGEDSSCCTLIAEKFALTSPEILVAQGFSRLLLAGILLDTGNLTGPHCTTKDKYMATLLVNGAGRFGSNGLYQLLRYKMYDTSDLTVVDILRKDFKKWTRVGKPDNVGSRSVMSYIGISSIGISIEQLLAREASSTGEIKYFQQLEKLRLLMIVSGYYDSQKNFKREILVTAESVELTKNLLTFLNSNASRLPLKVLHNPGLKEEMKLFEIENITSRKTIERLLEEFGGASKG
ncbi:exopolyphosphatase PRUNE1 isoform X1 [Manihot esculenta]|uniref:DHHA2 domain-containing protein n=1 Tax=Manihot esculenta TaxID=3983 RepID=A0A2C9U9G6_MANES|nr:exopolyphosphatase PRUNE1 isoform X1 [Manihot esculenta]